MIDERHEELAALYALDLLEGADRVEFETALERDPTLQALVRDLRESAAALAHTAPATPPPAALKDRVLSSIAGRIQGAPTIVPFETSPEPARRRLGEGGSSVFRSLLPWAIAAGFALSTAWLGSRYVAGRQEIAALQQQQELADLSLKSALTTLESERVVSQGQLATIIATGRQLDDATQRGANVDAQRAILATQLADARLQIAQRDREVAGALAEALRARAAATELQGQVASWAAETRQRERQLGAAQEQVARLGDELKNQAALADLKITTLASMLKNSPQALAVAVWDPKKQEGIVSLEKLPALAANQRFEFWVIEAKEGAKPVSAGVFTAGATRASFKPVSPIGAVAAFAVSRERDDGARSHAAPSEVIMLGKSQ